MSIINDALHKARQEKEKAQGTHRDPDEPEPKAAPLKQSSERSKQETQVEQHSSGRQVQPNISKPEPDKKIAAPTKKKNRLFALLPLGIITILIVSLTAIFLLKTRGTIIFPPQISTSISRVSTSPVDTSTTDTVLSAEQNRPKDESGFILTGVIHGGGAPMAVINGSVYMIGDSIEEAKIAEITDDKVVLENSGKRIELKVR